MEKETNLVKLKDVVISFTKNLWVPGKYDEAQPGPKKYSCTILVPKTRTEQIALINASIMKEALRAWKDKASETLLALKEDGRICVKDGDRKTYEGYPGNLWFRAANETRPTYLDQFKNPLTQESGKLYAGCKVNAIVSFWAQKDYGGRVNCNLMGLQFAGDGIAFSGGGVASKDEFEAQEGGEQTLASTVASLF